MTNLDIIARFQIKPGHEDAFRHWSERCMENVRQHGEGMSKYDWYISEDGTTCVVLESYEDSTACLKHMSDLGTLLMDGSDHFVSLAGEVCGTPSQELVDSLAELHVDYFSALQIM